MSYSKCFHLTRHNSEFKWPKVNESSNESNFRRKSNSSDLKKHRDKISMRNRRKNKCTISLFNEKKPNSKYQIIGAGIIKKWDDGYYHINVFDNKGEI